tara:strand:- start:280 stop:1302 length:1023 start_codon:yes stop_codon:yes gene_type:complete
MFIKKDIFLHVLVIISFSLIGCSSSKKPNIIAEQTKKINTKKVSTFGEKNLETKNKIQQSNKLNDMSNTFTDQNTYYDKNTSFSNKIRVKTIYELAKEHNPQLFLPHDEFETASDYENRISRQVLLMKDIVLLSSKKMDIKKAERLQIAKQKELEKQSKIESLMAESMVTVELKPDAIGRYNIEEQTFPIVVNGASYQVLIPKEEARAFKENFDSAKIEGLKQLKASNNIKINVKKAHIRTRPNGSILGIASKGHEFKHLKFEDEWHKIVYKGQVAYTHQNNALVNLVGLSDEYEYMDLVIIHPKTGSVFSLNSMKNLVPAPLDLASRKLLESGKADGPN